MTRSEQTALGSAYEELRPLLYHALSRLAREGWVVPFDDSRDLIHTFFLDVWPAIQSNYNPEEGSLRTYAFTAFVRFARREIIRQRRQAGQRIDLDHLETYVTIDPRDTAGEVYDAEALSRGLAQLPGEERAALHTYMRVHSEREVAAQLGTTRHRVRQLLPDAVGRLAVYLGAPSRIPEMRWQVTRSVLGEGRTLSQAAAHLDLHPKQAKAYHEQNLETLMQALRENTRSRKSDREKKRDTKVRDFLSRVLTAPNPEEHIDEMRERMPEVLDYLDQLEEVNAKEAIGIEPENLDPTRLAWLYGVFGGESGLSEEEQAEVEVCFYATAGEEHAVGEAYYTLLEGLPSRLTDLEAWFRSVPHVSKSHQDNLRNTPAVRAAPPEIQNLVVHGITPLTLYRAADTVPGLIKRARRYDMLPADAPITITIDDGTLSAEPKPPSGEAYVAEAAQRCKCSAETAFQLLAWNIEVAERKPLLFEGLEAEPAAGGGVRLQATEEAPANLHERWGAVLAGTQEGWT